MPFGGMCTDGQNLNYLFEPLLYVFSIEFTN